MDDTGQRKIKRSTIIIIVVVIVLAIAVATLAVLNKGAQSLPEGDSLQIKANNDDVRLYTVDEIKKMPSVTKYHEISSSKGEDESGDYTGVPIEDLLADADVDVDDYSEYIFTGSDGFKSSVFASDIKKGQNVLIVYAKDGEDLKDKGPLRVIVLDDPFGNRSTYLLKSIEAKS